MTADEVRSGEPRGRARRAVVLGGGLAGTTAALRLAEAGVETTLVETRPGWAASPSPSAATRPPVN